MKWTGQRRSGNVEDRRGAGGGFGRALGGGRLPGGRLSGGGLLLLALAAAVTYFTGDPLHLLSDGSSSSRARDPAHDMLADMTSVVLADTEDVWHELFAAHGLAYVEPRLVLFQDEGSRAASCPIRSRTGPRNSAWPGSGAASRAAI